ncbi:calmodulin [Paragonimus westermani]|uniref:Calmodulin n=2 Tax=Paragonimus westermani TaxID=34504 RepID=A0A5J4NHA7_9TREM|nr:calmodulin [Paragonimus westermani]
MFVKAQLQEQYDAADKQFNGRVPVNKVVEILRTFGFTNMQATRYVEPYSRHQDSCMSRSEFMLLLHYMKPNMLCEAQMRKKISEEDKSNAGKITAKQLKELLKECNTRLRPEQLETWLKTNQDKDGIVNYEEFFKSVRKRL